MSAVEEGALSGVTVVELGVAMAGPFCGMILADNGARVIKIERVGQGDESRAWPPFFGDTVSHYFAAANRNKESLAVDLKHPAGVEILRRLAARADVLIDNFRFGALERAGLGYEELRQLNDRLIYCGISGFGASGPRRDERANDLVMQAFAGGMSLTGEPGGGPVRMGISVCDIGAGMFGAIGILLALEARRRTGRGQRVDTSLLEGQVAMLANHFTSYFASGRPPQRRGSQGPGMVPYQAFRAKDDWMVVASFTERMWQGVCRAVGRPEWADDPRFDSARTRLANRDELIAMLSEVFATQTVDHWEARLKAEGVPFTRVNTIDRVARDDQVLAREMIAAVEHPEVGEIRMAGLPVKLSATPGRIRSAPPRLGEHSASILRELGYDAAAVEALLRDGVVGVPPAGATVPGGIRRDASDA